MRLVTGVLDGLVNLNSFFPRVTPAANSLRVCNSTKLYPNKSIFLSFSQQTISPDQYQMVFSRISINILSKEIVEVSVAIVVQIISP